MSDRSDRYLFRGKTFDVSAEWREGSLFYDGDDAVILNNLSTYSDGFMEAFGDSVCLDTISQCTGLKDKNGKLIFEGDIITSVSYPFQDERKFNYNALVAWDDELATFGYELHCVNPDKRGISHGMYEELGSRGEMSNYEIIGNAHDNPELLELMDHDT